MEDNIIKQYITEQVITTQYITEPVITTQYITSDQSIFTVISNVDYRTTENSSEQFKSDWY